jgi:siroheme synthase-like protein
MVTQADFVDAPIEGLEVVAREYRPEDLAGKSLAVAAGPAEVNRRVVEDSRKIGVWVCSATESESGDFTLPALWRSGPLTLTLSTSGASPALAASLRDRAVEALGPSAAGFAAILLKLRPVVLAQVDDPAKRAEIFRDWGDPRWLALYEKEGVETVEEQLKRRLDPELS